MATQIPCPKNVDELYGGIARWLADNRSNLEKAFPRCRELSITFNVSVDSVPAVDVKIGTIAFKEFIGEENGN